MKYLLASSAMLLALIVSAAPSQAQNQYPNGGYSQQQDWHGALRGDDQKKFDDYYNKWVDASRKNDRDDITSNARHMQDIMSRNNIPSNIPFDQIATNGAAGYGNQGAYPTNGYPNPNYPNGNYPNGGYQNPAYGQTRFSAEDQQKFDKAYEKWVDAQRKHDEDDVTKNAGHMQDIMARYNIPTSVPFAQLVSSGYATGTNAAYPYGYGQGAQRLSSKDQEDFDKAYTHWVDARRKKDMDDVDKNERKMREIMARNNIPANVSFDQIATAGSAYRK